MRLSTRKSETARLLRQEVDNFLTPAKILKMQAELNDLVKNQRGPAAEEVSRTAQMGDLSENAAYQFAKQHLRRLNDRVTILEERLKQAIPIDQGPSDGRVRIGSVVTLKGDKLPVTYTILGSSETNPAHGLISYSSPLGAALIGHVVGDRVDIQVSHGGATYTILTIT